MAGKLELLPLEEDKLTVSCGDASLTINLKDWFKKEIDQRVAEAMRNPPKVEAKPVERSTATLTPYRSPPPGRGKGGIGGISIYQCMEALGHMDLGSLDQCHGFGAYWPESSSDIKEIASRFKAGALTVPGRQSNNHLLLVMDAQKTLDLHTIRDSLADHTLDMDVTIALSGPYERR